MRSIDRKPGDSERAEDLLENIYVAWRNNRAYGMNEAIADMTMTKWEYKRVIAILAEGEYIVSADGQTTLELTTRGKEFAKDLLLRHNYIKEFLQMVCNIDEGTADHDACRIEHIVSSEVLYGIRDFMKHGQIRGRSITGADLNTLYDKGKYTFDMGIYESNVRYPRVFAKEMDFFTPEVKAVVGDESVFRLKLADGMEEADFWYLNDEKWIRAEISDRDSIEIPSSAFKYSISGKIPVTDADALIAFSEKGREPLDGDVRNLNIHLW
ncbi:MAG: hypothetical protein IJV66_03580 [Firmicutes bacterium]|nr:hypothetical protein [Bacillota bacterium]